MAILRSRPVFNQAAPVITKATTITNAVVKEFKNIRNGPTTLVSIEIDNTLIGGSDTIIWLKLYDVISEAFVAGTSKPVCIIPAPKGVVSDASLYAAGIIEMECPDGFFFENGLSLLASKEGGDTMAAAPVTAIDVLLTTK